MSVSIIIPTLNEEACIAATLRAVRALEPHEIIVVDGGSWDRTAHEVGLADRFLRGPRGRARQLNLGATHATGETLLFLHADCTLEAGALAAAERCLKRPGVVAGCFRQTVAARGWLYRCIDRCATARVRLTGLAYGDQGLFLRREVFQNVGGFPELPFLEDLFFSRQLARRGRLAIASKRIFVSARRWRQYGIVGQSLRNWMLTGLAAAGLSPQRLAGFYPLVR